jgi:hypothetical protein
MGRMANGQTDNGRYPHPVGVGLGTIPCAVGTEGHVA